MGENKLGRDSGEKYYKQKQQSTGEKVPSVLHLRNNRKAVGLESDELRGRVMGNEEEREAGAIGHRPGKESAFYAQCAETWWRVSGFTLCFKMSRGFWGVNGGDSCWPMKS